MTNPNMLWGLPDLALGCWIVLRSSQLSATTSDPNTRNISRLSTAIGALLIASGTLWFLIAWSPDTFNAITTTALPEPLNLLVRLMLPMIGLAVTMIPILLEVLHYRERQNR